MGRDSERFAARGVSHDRGDEDLLAKAAWFAQFSPDERLRMLVEWVDALVAMNPAIMNPEIRDVDRARPIAGRIQILERS